MSTPSPETPDVPAVQEERITISRAALRLELLQTEVRLKDYFSGRITLVEADIRDLQEANRIRDAAVEALAAETERRRMDISDDTSRWGVRGNKTTIVVGVVATLALVLPTIHTYL